MYSVKKQLVLQWKNVSVCINKHRSTGKIFFTGQQRLFDPRYIKAMEMIHAGTFGEINAIRTFWYQKWRLETPSSFC